MSVWGNKCLSKQVCGVTSVWGTKCVGNKCVGNKCVGVTSVCTINNIVQTTQVQVIFNNLYNVRVKI